MSRPSNSHSLDHARQESRSPSRRSRRHTLHRSWAVPARPTPPQRHGDATAPTPLSAQPTTIHASPKTRTQMKNIGGTYLAHGAAHTCISILETSKVYRGCARRRAVQRDSRTLPCLYLARHHRRWSARPGGQEEFCRGGNRVLCRSRGWRGLAPW